MHFVFTRTEIADIRNIQAENCRTPSVAIFGIPIFHTDAFQKKLRTFLQGWNLAVCPPEITYFFTSSVTFPPVRPFHLLTFPAVHPSGSQTPLRNAAPSSLSICRGVPSAEPSAGSCSQPPQLPSKAFFSWSASLLI